MIKHGAGASYPELREHVLSGTKAAGVDDEHLVKALDDAEREGPIYASANDLRRPQ